MRVETQNVFGVEASTNILLLHFVGTALGLVVSVILIRLVLFLRQTREIPSEMSWISWMMLLMYFSRTLRYCLIGIGIRVPFWFDLTPVFLAFVTVLSIPVVLYLYYGPLDGSKEMHQMRRGSHFKAALINAVVSPSLFVTALLLHGGAGATLAFCVACLLAAAFLSIDAAAFNRLRYRHRGLRLFFVLTTLGLLSVAVGFISSRVSGIAPRESVGIGVMFEMAQVFVVSGILFIFSNLRLADVFLKRVMRVYLWGISAYIVLACISCLSWRWANKGSMYEEASVGALELALIVTSVISSVQIAGKLDNWIDRWVFEQPDFVAAIRLLWDRLLSLTDEGEIYGAAEQALRGTLVLPCVKVLSRSAVSGNHPQLSLVGAGPHILHPNDPARRTLSPPIDMLIPIFHEGVAQKLFAVSRGTLRPPLTGAELAFIERVVVQVNTRLETLASEQQRTEKSQRESVLRQEIAESELRALRAQINPHFLFNSLNTIADLATTCPAMADRQYTTVREELDFVKSYLDIEKTRFESRLYINFEIDPRVMEMSIPTLLLQPLIENAMKHGIGPKLAGGTLIVKARCVDDGLELIVMDDGMGLGTAHTPSNGSDAHIGIQNVRRRLASAYQDHASFTLENRLEGGTRARITICTGNVQS